jgi:hypothetical protein
MSEAFSVFSFRSVLREHIPGQNFLSSKETIHKYLAS